MLIRLKLGQQHIGIILEKSGSLQKHNRDCFAIDIKFVENSHNIPYPIFGKGYCAFTTNSNMKRDDSKL